MKLKVVRLHCRKNKHRIKSKNPFPLNFPLTEITRNARKYHKILFQNINLIQNIKIFLIQVYV